MESQGKIGKIDNSKWGTPLVPVLQKDDGLRIYADNKVTINKALKNIKHPMSRIEEFFELSSGGTKFT